MTLASEKYVMAAKLSSLILLAYFFLAVTPIFNAGFYLKKKTFIFFIISFSAIILNISMNLVLLQRFGIVSAAVSAATSCMVSSILSIWISRKFITVKIDLKTVFTT